jgi:DNA mismatch repair ATPase MutS
MRAEIIASNVSPESGNSLPFRSILFLESSTSQDIGDMGAPETFSDLNLDQVVDAITIGREEYNLKPFFYLPLQSVEAINYRYDILRDLENPELATHTRSFAREMRRMRDFRVQEGKLYYKRQQQSWFLDAVDTYCNAVKRLSHDLMFTELHSSGFCNLCGYLSRYIESREFEDLVADTQKLKDGLKAITYSLHIMDKQIAVSQYDAEPDYGADVLHTFEKFSQGAAKEYRFDSRSTPDMNHVEAAVLDLVAKLHPEIFLFLEKYSSRHSNYLNTTIAIFDREVQFYLACLEHVQHFKQAGLPFCYPVVSGHSKEDFGKNVFDLALANKLLNERAPVITNDFYLRGPERIFVVSGPNQGGKTTFARTFGQLHYLASIGCPVPGSEAQLFLFDRLFTHFEKEEDIRNLSGKLEDELIRIHRILECATPNSILIMNESFLSTTLSDALFLSRQIMQQIIARNMLCVSVTFLDELAAMSETTVSMVSAVNPKDPALRTFKVIRKPADGLAYAAAIAGKYRLTHDAVKARIAKNKKESGAP